MRNKSLTHIGDINTYMQDYLDESNSLGQTQKKG